MPPYKDPEKEIAINLAHKLLICSTYSHRSSIYSLHLIDFKEKSETVGFLEETKLQLRNTICNLYKLSSEVNIERESLKLPPLSHPFTPIKLSKGVCCRCDIKSFTIRINQFGERHLKPYLTQFRRDISGKKFTDHPSIDYLHLIDYSSKAYDFFPYLSSKIYEKFILADLLPLIEKDIRTLPMRLLPFILPRFISTLKLMDLESTTSSSLNFYFKIIDYIIERNRTEPLMLLGIWESLRMSDRLVVCAFERLTNHLPYRGHEKLKWVLIMSNYIKFDLHGAWVRGNKLKNYSNCPVTSALLAGNYQQMKVLLEYGFLQNSRPLARYNIFLRHLTKLEMHLNRPLVHSPIGQYPIVREVLMFLIAKYIHQGDSLASKLDKCFHLLWSFIPDPFVTKQQLLDEKNVLFLPYPEGVATEELKSEIESVIDIYDELDFLSMSVYEPRPLGHLCKCVIRRSLTVAGNLPTGVRHLSIPQYLQNWLLPPNESDFR